MTKISLAVMLAAGHAAPKVHAVLPSARSPLAGVWAQVAQMPVANAVTAPAFVPREESAVPAWFDASGLSIVYLRAGPDGFAVAVLRRGRNELTVYLDSRGDQAVFTRHALNPMGTPQKEERALNSPAVRRAVADILRRAPAPTSAAERALLEEILRALS